MLTHKQIEEIREALHKSQNPLFFFDNDADGLCSFLLLARAIERGRGVAIKSFPELDKGYARKVEELKPDCVFILDKPLVSEQFIEEVRKQGLPVIWIDHHDVEARNFEGVNYFNPIKNEGKSSEPTTYLAYKISGKKEDLWIAMAGCISDNYLPEFADDFKKNYPDLWKENINSAFQALYETYIGKITRILGFSLKDRTSNVIRMIKMLLRTKNPLDILDESNKNSLMYRFKQVDKRYQKLLEKASGFKGKSKLLYFQYGGELSLSADLANELSYKCPDKLIAVSYINGAKANLSIRGKNARAITMKVIESLEGASGGGHDMATGCRINVEDLPKFKERVEKLIG